MAREKQKRRGPTVENPMDPDARINMRVDVVTLRKLRELTKAWKCKNSEAVRRSIALAWIRRNVFNGVTKR